MNRVNNEKNLILPRQRPSLEKGRTEAAQGRLHRAAIYFKQAIKEGDAGADASHLALSDLYYEWNDLSLAAFHIQAGLSISKLQSNIPMQILALRLWARLQLASNYVETANEAMREVHDLTEEHQLPMPISMQNVEWEIMLALNQNNVSNVSHWLAQLPAPGEAFYPIQSIVYARALIMLNRKSEVQLLLKPWVATAVSNKLYAATISLLALQALSTYELPTIFLTDALTFARKERFIRTFVDFGSEMKQLLYQAKNINAFNDYIDVLLAAYKQAPPEIPELASPPFKPIDPVANQLSTEDMALIRLIMSGKTSAEISSQLELPYPAVKERISQLNSKLGI